MSILCIPQYSTINVLGVKATTTEKKRDYDDLDGVRDPDHYKKNRKKLFPDEYKFMYEEIQCVIDFKGAPFNSIRGYIVVPKKYKLHEEEYRDVHMGIDINEVDLVTKTRKFGFVCNHLCDRSSNDPKPFPGSKHRSVDYVVTELQKLVNILVYE